MDHLRYDTTTDILDFSVPASHHSNSAPLNIQVNSNPVWMSSEEVTIRGELEEDIERDLEQEIKDEIYHLALRLHRLYQHQKERDQIEKANKIVSEVNISIRLEGGTKIEISESKKEVPDNKKHMVSKPDYILQNMILNGSKNKKFDWEKSLRSSEAMINKRSNQGGKALGWKC